MSEPDFNEADEKGLLTGDETAPKTGAELQNALDRLAQTAYANGVEINDVCFELRHDGHEIPDWEIEFVRLRKKRNPEE